MMRRRSTGLFLAGLVVIVAAAAQIHASTGVDRYSLLRSDRLPWWVLFTAVLVASAYALGLPELPSSRREVIGRAAAAFASGLGAVSLVQVALASPLLPRSSLLGAGLAVPVWSLTVWLVIGRADRRGHGVDRVLAVVGDVDGAAALETDLARGAELPAQLVGVVKLEDARPNGGSEGPLIATALELGPTVVVLDTAAQADHEVVHQVAVLHQRGVRVRSLALFYEGWLGKLPLSDLERVSLLFDIGELHRTRYMRSKRLFDLALGAVGLLVLTLVIPIVWMLNLLGNRGQLFFRQERVGKGGAVFVMWKFRTMVASGQSDWTADHDQRITPVGRVLRQTHLDELPQVVNILRGELSTVGPRPEQVRYVELLRDRIPFYDVRHLVRPGLTGWAQVKQGYAASDEDTYEKLQYDFFYLRRQGLALDLRIAWRTLRDVAGGGR